MRALPLVLAAGIACGGEPPPTGPRDWPAREAPASTVPEPGVRREVFLVPGVAPPGNPVTGEATPAEWNATQVARYRTDVEPPAPARAILVAYPGFLGGAGSWDRMARAIVRRGFTSNVHVEVWAIDRRANLLEDLRGLDTAEVEGNPEIADGYYTGRDTVGGVGFAGLLDARDLTFMSEWGLATHVEDLRRVIALVPEGHRRARVFLLGHSMGASFAEAYAAWRFEDGARGVDELAGLVLVDGVLRDEPISEQEYEDGAGGGLTAMPGLDAIRRRGRSYFELPLLGSGVHVRAEIMALRVLVDPSGIVEDGDRDDMMRILMSYSGGPVPRMTNAGAFGLAFDDESNGLTFAAVSLGTATGGAMETYTSAIFGATLKRPADPGATYDWIHAHLLEPREHTRMGDLALAWSHGVTNFSEWYFPARIPLDLAAVGGARVPEDGWQAAAGLRAFDGGEIDAPILAIAGPLAPPDAYPPLAARVAPAIGPGRPAAGATRGSPAGFQVIDATALTHIDPLTAEDVSTNPAPAAVWAFVMEHAANGTVAIPAP